MKRHASLATIALAAALTSSPAKAFIEDPFVTPTIPTSRTPISVNVHAGGCHGFFDQVDEAELVVTGPAELQLITDGAVPEPGHPFCIYPDYVYRFDIGMLPTGSYTLRLFIRDAFHQQPLPFGSVEFTVAAPTTIPATDRSSLVVLAMIFAIAAAAAARNRDA